MPKLKKNHIKPITKRLKQYLSFNGMPVTVADEKNMLANAGIFTSGMYKTCEACKKKYETELKNTMAHLKQVTETLKRHYDDICAACSYEGTCTGQGMSCEIQVIITAAQNVIKRIITL